MDGRRKDCVGVEQPTCQDVRGGVARGDDGTKKLLEASSGLLLEQETLLWRGPFTVTGDKSYSDSPEVPHCRYCGTRFTQLGGNLPVALAAAQLDEIDLNG